MTLAMAAGELDDIEFTAWVRLHTAPAIKSFSP